MEGIIAECGEKDRIGKFVDEIMLQTGKPLTDQKRNELIEDIHEKLYDINNQRFDITEILIKYFPDCDLSKISRLIN